MCVYMCVKKNIHEDTNKILFRDGQWYAWVMRVKYISVLNMREHGDKHVKWVAPTKKLYIKKKNWIKIK